MSVTIYHNPRCSKSRQTLALLEENGVEPTIVEYLKDPPSADTLKSVSKKLGLRPKDFVRKKEAEFKDLAIDLEDDDALYQAMNEFPKIIERPIVVKGSKAALGRPPENVLEIL